MLRDARGPNPFPSLAAVSLILQMGVGPITGTASHGSTPPPGARSDASGLSAPAPPVSAGAVTMAIQGGTLIDGTGSAPRPDVTILVADRRIVGIGPAASTPVPAGATIVRADGKFIIPGLIDAHVHHRDHFAELLITHGITSIVDWGGSTVEWILAQKDGVAKGKLYGPRIYTVAETVGGAVAGQDERATVDAAVRRVRELAALGVDKIAMDFNVSPPVMRAIIDEAHRLGLPASGYPLRARESIELGIDSIKHLHTLGRANADPAALERFAEQVERGATRGTVAARRGDVRPCVFTAPYEDLLGLMVSRRTVYIPSLVKDFKTVLDRRDEFARENLDLLSDPALGYLPVLDLLPQLTHVTEAGLRDTPCGIIDTLDRSAQNYELFQRSYRDAKDFIRKMVAAGGRVLAGTAPHSYVMPGISLHHEMLLFVDAGLTPMQSLQSATLWVAEYVNAQQDIGSLEEGKYADLLVLAANPLDDIRNARRIETVVQGGRVLPTGYHRSFVNQIPRNTTRTPPSGGYPEPEVTGIAPPVATEGSDDLTIRVTGRRLSPNSVVFFEAVPLQTRFVSQTELTALVPARLLGSVGTYWLHVFTPRPRGGTSDRVSLIVKFR